MVAFSFLFLRRYRCCGGCRPLSIDHRSMFNDVVGINRFYFCLFDWKSNLFQWTSTQQPINCSLQSATIIKMYFISEICRNWAIWNWNHFQTKLVLFVEHWKCREMKVEFSYRLFVIWQATLLKCISREIFHNFFFNFDIRIIRDKMHTENVVALITDFNYFNFPLCVHNNT